MFLTFSALDSSTADCHPAFDMVEIHVEYQGGLRCESRHGPSSRTLLSDAPVDNCGKGESFSPTDLVATALGSCMLTIMGIVADKRGIDIQGAVLDVTKSMVADPARRIGKLEVRVHVPGAIEERVRTALEKAALGCPVFMSLSDKIEIPVEFRWDD